ncbi:hypothetical protein BJ875DRAFT_485341 [Amylocarpus encephaloides]|uniref:2EXR domain-containing protein n=1 Tax=Amylocarpus encephaloides TaxID=45428 RepID=A0A9P7YGF9_9HELO|nr:hypothetical protein BJ875DRAFT_485341 [Amylocarpus encephaloides]
MTITGSPRTHLKNLSGTIRTRRLARDLTVMEEKEVKMYQKQDHFRQAEEHRAKEFQKKLWKMRREFEEFQGRERTKIRRPLTNRIWFYGIKESRRMAVPAYTFENFLKLPCELRLTIWNLIARLEEPDTYQFMCMKPNHDYHPFDSSYLHGSSEFGPESHERPAPVLFHICREARSVARTIYTKFPYAEENSEARGLVNAYFNTLSSSFYLGDRHRWSDYKILVDMLIKINRTRPLPGRVPQRLEAFKRIGNLVVNVGIFAVLPGRIWAEFSNLKNFTVSFYPLGSDTHDPDASFEERHYPKFEKPRSRNCHHKWATQIHNHVTECLFANKLEFPEWNPTIDVVAQINATTYTREEINSHWDSDWAEEFDIEPSEY